jgi:DNA-binding XRE family transcriptional regulator
MPTENRRIATYLPKQIDDRLEAFKSERSIKGDSQALIVILSEFFGVSQQVAYSVDYSSFATQEQLEALSLKVNNISEKLSELSSKLFSELPRETEKLNEHIDAVQLVPLNIEVSPTGELLSGSSVSINPDNAPKSELSSISPDKSKPPAAMEGIEALTPLMSNNIRLSVNELTKRLNVSRSTMSLKRKDAPEKFAVWTLVKDPDAIAWSFVPESGDFQPIGNIPDELKSELPQTLFGSSSHSELAKHLGIDNSTLSHWKKNKSPDELLKATSEKDPNSIGWILIPGSKRFKPDADLQSKQDNPLQGDLLSESVSESPAI